MRPALRYHGGKWRLAPWIIKHLPAHRIYVEPYGGAASVLLRKERSFAEVYNDLDGELVNFFRVLRDVPDVFLRLARKTPFSRKEFEWAYTHESGAEDPGRRALKTLIRSFQGFGSTGISSRKTGFRAKGWRQRKTAPDDWRGWPDAAEELAKRLQGVVIEDRDAFRVMDMHDGSDTLFYVDPPYVHSTRGPDHLYRYELSDEDHARLLAKLLTMNGMVVLSGYRNPLYDRMLKGWKRHDHLSGTCGKKKAVESLWVKP